MKSTHAKTIPPFSAAVMRSLFAQVVASESGCWEWAGYRDPNGYGVAKVDRVPYRAHRIFFQQFVAALEQGLVIDHLCRNTRCVNPMHLEQVTVAVNTYRGIGQTSANRLKSECPKGHAYDSENTYVTPIGGRQCRICTVQSTREWRARNRRVRTTCRKGHEWTPENTIMVNHGIARRCRICAEAYEADRNARLRGITAAKAQAIA